MSVPEILSNLNEDGVFSDLVSLEKKVMYGKDSQAEGLLLTEAMNRLWKLSEEFRNGEKTHKTFDMPVFRKIRNAVLYYGNLEINRSNRVNRFHASCFAIPTAAVNIYFSFYKQMNAVERGEVKNDNLSYWHKLRKAESVILLKIRMDRLSGQKDALPTVLVGGTVCNAWFGDIRLMEGYMR